MTLLLLVRHATNDLQKDDVLAGWTPGVHLSQAGRAQAEALAQRLTSLKIEAIYTSPLERTLETAEIIAAPHELTVVTREGLGEVRFGISFAGGEEGADEWESAHDHMQRLQGQEIGAGGRLERFDCFHNTILIEVTGQQFQSRISESFVS